MQKNILIISSSPRANGNSELLCEEFKRGAESAGHLVQFVTLRTLSISPCKACDYCRSHEGTCVMHDDMKLLLEQMIDADIIVLATPVYFYSLSAQLKTVIDRTVAKYAKIIGKELYYIVTAADTEPANLERTVECLRGFADCLPGSVERGVVRATGVWQRGAISNSSFMTHAYEMGSNA